MTSHEKLINAFCKALGIDSEKIIEAEEKLTKQIETFKPGLLGRCNPDEYIRLIQNYAESLPYRHISNDVRLFCKSLVSESSEDIMELFHKLVLVKLISQNQRKTGKQFPEQIDFWFQKNFSRIFKNLNRKKSKQGVYSYPNDRFFKELGVCSLRMIPAGSQKLDICGFSRSFFIKNGIVV